MYASTSFATGARVDNDLTVNGTLFINGSSLKTTDGLLRDKGVWLPDTPYSAGDVVQIKGSSYVCINANVNNTPPDTKNWSVLAAQGIQGIQGIQGLKGDTGLPGPISDLPGGINTQSGKVQRDFLTYSTLNNVSTLPLHIKTNLSSSGRSCMYRFLVEGFNYGSGGPIFSQVAGFIDSIGVTAGSAVDFSPGVKISQYLSSDHFLVIRLDSPQFYYTGFSVSAWFVNGFITQTVSAVVYSSATNL